MPRCVLLTFPSLAPTLMLLWTWQYIRGLVRAAFPSIPPFFVVVAGVIFSFTCEVVGNAAAARQPGCCHAGEKGVYCLGCSIRAALQWCHFCREPPLPPLSCLCFLPRGWLSLHGWRMGEGVCVCAPSSRPNLLDIVGRKEKESLCVLCMWTPLSFKQSTDHKA